MNKKYIIPIVLLLGLAITLVLLPGKKSYDEVPATELLQQITSTSRFVNADIVADRLIKKDPSMMLIDVRSEELFREFSLPGAMNIPLKDLAIPENSELLTQEGIDFIFFSTGDVMADQAWILCRRLGYDHIFVLEGGLNGWFSSFFMIRPPAETASGEEIALFQFRSAVRQYFAGGEAPALQKPAGETITITPKKKKSAAEGGC
jgi:rhodanese-related sulfurtransferase